MKKCLLKKDMLLTSKYYHSALYYNDLGFKMWVNLSKETQKRVIKFLQIMIHPWGKHALVSLLGKLLFVQKS